MPRPARAVLALALGTLIAFVLLEATLWALALAVAPEERGAPVADDGRPSILCVGDSNTYGIFLEPEDSYPGQLQAFLRAGGAPHVVVNRGYPGQNTAQVRVGLEELLRDAAPAAVVAFVGVNDRWSDEGRPAWSDAPQGALAGLLAKSRALKLLRLIRTRESAAGATTAAFAPEERLPDDRFPGPPEVLKNKASEDTRASIRANLAAVAALCRERGATPVFVGYPLFSPSIRDDVNASIRAAAEAAGAPYVDLAARFEGLVSDFAGEQLYIPGDAHLSAIGNHEAARQVFLALRDAGVVDAPPPPPLEEVYGGVTLSLERDGDEAIARITGPPGWRFVLRPHEVHAAPRRPRGVLRFVSGDVADRIDPAALRSWRGRLDDEGRATTRIGRLPASDVDSWLRWEISVLAFVPKGAPREKRFCEPLPWPE